MTERESMSVDVVIVGAGPSGLSAAIRLKQLADEAGTDISIVVLEKAAEIGGHILSGAVIDPSALSSLIPDWQEKGAPLTCEVTSDKMMYLTEKRQFTIPTFLLPPVFNNHGNHIASLAQLCAWLGDYAQNMGIDIFPGFAATELLYDEQGHVKGVATGDMGVGKDGAHKPTFAQGMEIHARYSLIAEGARGSLAKQLVSQFELDKDCDPQHYGLGIKEVWELDPDKHRPGHVEHHLGWPLSDDTGGGGFVYHAADHLCYLGFVTHLDYKNPTLSPFDEMQRWKTHPHMRALLKGGKRIAYGARALTEGGWQSIPELAFPGGALMGCAAGFMNVPRIKGSHNAMQSGIKTAEAVFEALAAGRGNDTLKGLKPKVTKGAIEQDLKPVRNVKPLLKLGTRLGMLVSGFDLWCQSLFKFSLLGTVRNAEPDHKRLLPLESCKKINYPKPDGVLIFDKASSVHLANLAHDEDQPVHLVLADTDRAVTHNLPLYGEPAQLYCPASVYEVIDDTKDAPRLQINAANCVHCKSCDIKDPTQNIDWVPPEGGSGPNYQNM